MQAHLALPTALLLAGGISSCGGETATPKLNVLFVTIDTLRADHLGCYGYFRETSPQIDALAGDGILFENCLSVMGTTLPAHLSLYTGLFPFQHGYTSNKKAGTNPYTPVDGVESAAQFFGRAGYRTGGFVSGQTLKSTTGIHAGFSTWTEPDADRFRTWRDLERPAVEATDDALAFLQEPSDEPFFAWLHLWDPHEPNEPQPGYVGYFETDDQLEDLVTARHIDSARLEAGFDSQELARSFYPDKVMSASDRSTPVIEPIDRGSVLDLHNRYDAEIRYVDDQLGRVFDTLKEMGLWESTIICVTGDHGQSNGQHDWLEHGQITLDNVHVPLVFRFPDSVSRDLPPRGSRVDDLVSAVDVMLTLVSRIDAPEFRGFYLQADGGDLFSEDFDRGYVLSERAHHPDRENPQTWPGKQRYGLSEGRWRYYGSGDPEQPHEQLFDTTGDPYELEDVAVQHPEVVARLRARVLEVLARGRRVLPDSGELNDEQLLYLDNLREHGYIGGEED